MLLFASRLAVLIFTLLPLCAQAALDVGQIGTSLVNTQSVLEFVGSLIFSMTGALVVVAIVIRMIKRSFGGKTRTRARTASRRTGSMSGRYGRSYGRQSYRNHVYDK